MKECLARAEAALADGPWLAGRDYSLADMAMAPFIDRIRNLRPDLIAEAKYPQLLDWYARMRARPAFTRAFDFHNERTAALPNI